MNIDEMNLQSIPSELRDTAQSLKEETSRACHRAQSAIRSNPVPTIVGALVFGVAVGLLVSSGRQRELNLREHLLNETENLGKHLNKASSQLSSLLHNQLDAAGKRTKSAAHFVQDHVPELSVHDVLDSVSDSINRFLSKAKFW